jgi:putative serine protease PepD
LTDPKVSGANAPEVNRQFFFQSESAPSGPSSKAPVSKKAKAGISVSGALIIGSIVGGVFGGAAGVAGFMVATQPAPVIVNNTDSVTWVTAVAAKALPSVVTISVDSTNTGGSGSGVFLTKDGYILTNSHVVTLEGATTSATIQVRTTDGRIFTAKLVGTDPTNDLAVIKVNAAIEFTPIEWADSSNLNVGAPVVAIGAPLGLPSSVTSGVLSALNRTIQVADSTPEKGGSSLQWWNGTGAAPVSLRVLQTDAAINPGNSGGALVNDKGQLIGINVAIATASSPASGSQSGSIGVGFAIPSNVAKRIGEELMVSGKASHALLGALVSDYSADGSKSGGFSTGALVSKLSPGGAGEKAGLKVGDVVIRFNGQAISSSSELTAAVRFEKAGAMVELVALRDGKEVTIDVTLGDLAAGK